jgi:hypothetical protein
VEGKDMTQDRFTTLMRDDTLSLTQAEIAEGWHFCAEFDGLLTKGNPMEPHCGDHCVDAEMPNQPLTLF